MKPALMDLGGDEGEGKSMVHSFVETVYTEMVFGMTNVVSSGPS